MRLIDADMLLDEICRDQCEHKYRDCDSTCEIAAYVANAPTIGSWISVKDRMPEEPGRYLCWFGKNVFAIGAEVVNYIPDMHGFGSLQSLERYDNVTHWMPITEPPKEADNAQE